MTDEDQIIAVWEAFYQAWAEQLPNDEPDPAAFAELSTDPEAMTDTLVAHRLDTRPTTVAHELWPTVTIGGNTASITDCAISSQRATADDDPVTITSGWEAEAIAGTDGWRIQTVHPTDLFCIPVELNEQLLTSYRIYRAALDDAWNPPDPDHRGLNEIAVGEHLLFLRELLAEHRRDGIVIREPAPTDNAVVFEIGLDVATVSDCTEQVVGYGAFDLATGDRLDDLIAPVREGRLDAQSIDLVRGSDGQWRVNGQAASRDTDCVPGSTRLAVR